MFHTLCSNRSWIFLGGNFPVFHTAPPHFYSWLCRRNNQPSHHDLARPRAPCKRSRSSGLKPAGRPGCPFGRTIRHLSAVPFRFRRMAILVRAARKWAYVQILESSRSDAGLQGGKQASGKTGHRAMGKLFVASEGCATVPHGRASCSPGAEPMRGMSEGQSRVGRPTQSRRPVGWP